MMNSGREMTKLRGLDELPTKALERLVELLNYGSRRTCRLVSKTLKRYVDQAGLSVKIDTRRPKSIRCSQNVKVTEAVITYLETLGWDKKYLENWKTVIISGFIKGNWFTNGLQRNCTNLRVLIIHDQCLVSQDFVQPTNPLPIFDHLTQIQIFVNQTTFLDSIAKGTKTASELTMKKHMNKAWKKVDIKIQKNIIYLLQTIRSRVLKVIHANAFTVDPINSKKSEAETGWEHEPLFEFIQSHSSTLEEVLVPNLLLGDTEFDQTVYKVPCKLQTLVLTMKTILTYWKTLLLNQNSLQNLGLHVYFESHPETVFYFILLNSVLLNNARTLVCLRLAFSNPVCLNMKMFQVCESLEYIMIDALVAVDIMNLNQLPLKTLGTLNLGRNNNIGSDFDGIQFLKDCHRPKYLRFLGLATDCLFTDPKYMLKFLKLVFRSRTLNAVCMSMTKELKRTGPRRIFNPAELLEYLGKATAQSYGSVSIWDFHYLVKSVQSEYKTSTGEEYVMAKASSNLNYLEIVMGLWLQPSLEQPLNFPRNADSYVIYENQKTKAQKIDAQIRPYQERISNLEIIQVIVDER